MELVLDVELKLERSWGIVNLNSILLCLQRFWRGIFRPVFGGKKTYGGGLMAETKMVKLWVKRGEGGSYLMVVGLSYFRTFPQELLVFYGKIGSLVANFWRWIVGP